MAGVAPRPLTRTGGYKIIAGIRPIRVFIRRYSLMCVPLSNIITRIVAQIQRLVRIGVQHLNPNSGVSTIIVRCVDHILQDCHVIKQKDRIYCIRNEFILYSLRVFTLASRTAHSDNRILIRAHSRLQLVRSPVLWKHRQLQTGIVHTRIAISIVSSTPNQHLMTVIICS